MKANTQSYWRGSRRVLGLVGSIVIGASIVITFSGLLGAGPDIGGFAGKMRQWQERMSEAFRDGINALRGKTGDEKSAGGASMDLREQSDSYILRLSLPDRDLAKVEVTFDGGALRIKAPEQGAVGRYEQSIVLADVPQNAPLQIDRRQKDNVIVIAVPKSTVARQDPTERIPGGRLFDPLSDWDRSVMDRMERMRREMDRIFKESFDEFKIMPEHKGFFDEQRFGSSFEMKEEGENYVVRAYLPGRDVQNVNVTVDSQTLKIEAAGEESTGDGKDGKPFTRRKNHYAQVITLPGPVDAVKMKTERKDGVLIVTLPKMKTP